MTKQITSMNQEANIAGVQQELSIPKSLELRKKFNGIIPGGSHTYAKGDDQYPEFYAPYLVSGKGCRVKDLDGNEYIEYAMGLRAVTLGHAYPAVVEAAARQMEKGCNFNRPSPVELECAGLFLDIIQGGEMVKFAKNGSDVTSAAVRLSRAYTGRDKVAICQDHPFFSVDDWFIGSTAMDAGIPGAVKDLTLKFRYNDLQSVARLFEENHNQIACVMLEVEKQTPPAEGFLQNLKELCHQNGAVMVFDEIITGFRWDLGGAQRLYNVVPDLSTFGKALGNGFSVSALTGKREIMELGGLDHQKERVFLLSTTYGCEYHALAAAIAVMNIYKNEPVIDHLYEQGRKLEKGINHAVADLGLEGYFELSGRPCCLVYSTRDEQKQNSQSFRTLFLQETIKRGIIAPSLVVSYSHSDQDVAETIDKIYDALTIYKQALDHGIEKYLIGNPVKPVFRKYNQQA